MVNVIIYLKEEFQAEELVKFLLEEKLIAAASIDVNNTNYRLKDNIIQKEIFNVITAQTKSLLINQIIKKVEEKFEGEILINSTPIVGSNSCFDELVKQNTQLI